MAVTLKEMEITGQELSGSLSTHQEAVELQPGEEGTEVVGGEVTEVETGILTDQEASTASSKVLVLEKEGTAEVAPETPDQDSQRIRKRLTISWISNSKSSSPRTAGTLKFLRRTKKRDLTTS